MAQNSFRVFQGDFLIKGFRPDGDSVRFQPHDPGPLSSLDRADRVPHKSGPLQVRMEGMDTPETHYGPHAQPYGDRARDELLRRVGFTSVHQLADETVTDCQPESVAGAIVTRAFDPHGRPISYVFVGGAAAKLAEGSQVAVPADLLSQSVNAAMIEGGVAYPLLYTSAPEEHRSWLREAALRARTQGLGLWPQDRTARFPLTDERSLAVGGALIFPKFFRRCADYLQDRQAHPGLVQWLEANPQENDRVLVRGQEQPLSSLFRQQDGQVECLSDLLDLVFIEK